MNTKIKNSHFRIWKRGKSWFYASSLLVFLVGGTFQQINSITQAQAETSMVDYAAQASSYAAEALSAASLSAPLASSLSLEISTALSNNTDPSNALLSLASNVGGMAKDVNSDILSNWGGKANYTNSSQAANAQSSVDYDRSEAASYRSEAASSTDGSYDLSQAARYEQDASSYAEVQEGWNFSDSAYDKGAMQVLNAASSAMSEGASSAALGYAYQASLYAYTASAECTELSYLASVANDILAMSSATIQRYASSAAMNMSSASFSALKASDTLLSLSSISSMVNIAGNSNDDDGIAGVYSLAQTAYNNASSDNDAASSATSDAILQDKGGAYARSAYSDYVLTSVHAQEAAFRLTLVGDYYLAAASIAGIASSESSSSSLSSSSEPESISSSLAESSSSTYTSPPSQQTNPFTVIFVLLLVLGAGIGAWYYLTKVRGSEKGQSAGNGGTRKDTPPDIRLLTKQEWLERFEASQGRPPTMDEFSQARKNNIFED